MRQALINNYYECGRGSGHSLGYGWGAGAGNGSGQGFGRISEHCGEGFTNEWADDYRKPGENIGCGCRLGGGEGRGYGHIYGHGCIYGACRTSSNGGYG